MCRAEYAISVFVLGFLVTLAGQGSIYWLMSRLQRRSIVIIAMAGLMLLATVMMYYKSIVSFLWALHHHTLTKRGYICSHRYVLRPLAVSLCVLYHILRRRGYVCSPRYVLGHLAASLCMLQYVLTKTARGTSLPCLCFWLCQRICCTIQLPRGCICTWRYVLCPICASGCAVYMCM